jgi:hypothetical protein
MMTKLACPDCQHENEPERIYCHNCGARLDRSAVVKEKVAEGESDAGTQKHLKKMFDPGRGRGIRVAVKLGKMLLGALCLAVLIELILPPEFPPEPKNYSFAPMINMDMVSAISSRQPSQLTYNEEQINSYFASNLRRRDSPAKEGYFPLRRVVAKFQEGTCEINIQRQFYGLSIYSGCTYRVQIENGKIIGSATGGYIGRIPIHPQLMKYADTLLQKAWASLARERNSVAKLAGIEFHPQSVTLIIAR